MAAAPGGLTTTIRRKLQDGKAPEDIVQELVAGGLGQSSAQRFVDRAMAEGASAPPLPPPEARAATPADGLDQFIQTKAAESEAESAKTGQRPLWVASILMCSGIAITAFSYITAEPGQRFTLMWGPVVFGFLLWGKTVLGGLANTRTFAWFSAAGSIALPAVLAVVLLGVAFPSEPTEEDARQAELSDSAGPAPDYLIPDVDAENLTEVIRDFDIASDTRKKCDLANALSKYRGEGRAWVALELSNRVRKWPPRYPAAEKICTANAVMTLDTDTGIRLYEEWRQGTNARLKNEAELVLANDR